MQWVIPPAQDDEILCKVILSAAEILKPEISWADPVALLGALAESESSFGAFNVPRFERAYGPGGSYWTEDQAKRYHKWGALACCSYSSFQIMYPTAVELGFDADRCPLDLWFDEIAIHSVVAYIRKRVLANNVKTIEDFSDAFNSGKPFDSHVPTVYIENFKNHYAKVLDKHHLRRQSHV